MVAKITLELPETTENKLIFPDYCNGSFSNLNDYDMIDAIKEVIEEAIIENRVYYDLNDIERAIEIVYPVIANIVFNSNFKHIRSNYSTFCEVITYLVTRLA